MGSYKVELETDSTSAPIRPTHSKGSIDLGERTIKVSSRSTFGLGFGPIKHLNQSYGTYNQSYFLKMIS